MSLFIRNNNNKRRNISSNYSNELKSSNKFQLTTKLSKKALNEEISSDSDDEERDDGFIDAKRKRALNDANDSDSSETMETAQEKKIRLAKKYLEEIESEERERNNAEVIDKSIISDRIRDDLLEKSGRLRKKIADNYLNADIDKICCLKNGHKLSVTCCVISSDSNYLFSSSKDSSIIKWDVKCAKKLKIVSGVKKQTKKSVHHKHIISLAISSDDKFLASGCYDKIINIWSVESLDLLHTFRGHRGAVSGLAFRKGFHQLFSCSFDRSVKVWNVDDMSYVETLFGHQDSVIAIDSFIRERAITAGGSDSSLRIWKIVEESQLVFQTKSHSIDCVKFIDEQHFISASDDGTFSLWAVLKKKPLMSYQHCHGMDSSGPNWITALAVIKNTDIIASGSKDGTIKLWKCSEDFKKLEPLFTIPVIGFVNCLEFSNNGDYLIAGIGREHRLGRWWSIKEAKNSVLIIPLIKKSLNN